MIYPLDNTIQNYAWGSRTALAELRGASSPASKPEAELWMGAHASAPSCVRRNGSKLPLPELITEDPEAALGSDVVSRFGPRLPFLLKVLAAATPLSLQAHPTEEQAMRGFAREEAAGVPRTAATRNYKDAQHKPELLVALTPFFALSGFRPVAESRRLFAELDVPELRDYLAPLAEPDAETALRGAFERLMRAPRAAQAALVSAVATALRRALANGSEFSPELGWAERIRALYPDDIGVVSALLLNLVELAPGQAIYLPAGNLHAYLGGVGVEIMASSDNVLRGGLTPKHVDVPELLGVLDFSEFPAEPLDAQRVSAVEALYATPAAEFRLSRVALDGSAVLDDRHGPEILIVTDGTLELGGCSLTRGMSAFVPASEPDLPVRGFATAFRARVPERSAPPPSPRRAGV